MKKRLALLIALALLAGCHPSAEALRERIAADYPSVDGSTSAHPLQRTLACELLDTACTWSAMDSENVQRTIVPAESATPVAQAVLGIAHSGTHGAYVNLIEGQADVILVAREPSEDELRAAEELGVVLDVRPVALDAFVFLANVENPVESLPVEALRAIYTGEVTTWTELGVRVAAGAEGDEPLHAYQRNRNSGIQELMEGLVMRGTAMEDAPNLITNSMLGPLNAIGGDPWTGDGDRLGLGYSVYYYATFMFPHEYVKLIGVDGVRPTAETIANRAYPLTTEVHVAVREGTPAESTAILFRDWLLTEDGQRAIARSGYVPIEDVGP